MVDQQYTCFLYRRVSSQSQDSKGTSLEGQLKWGSEWVEMKKGNLLKDQKYVQSGETCLTENENEILSFIDNHKVTHFLVYSLDRLTRNFISGIIFLKKIFDREVILVTSTNEFKDLKKPKDLFYVVFELLIAQIERDNINSRTIAGIISRFKMGSWPRKSIPFGFKKDQFGRLQIISELEPVIHRIFGLFCRHQCYTAVARMVNEMFMQILPFKITNKKIKKILTDQIYIGKTEHAGETIQFSGSGNEGIDTRIIKEALFERAQVIVEKISDKNNKNRRDNQSQKMLKKFITANGFEPGIDLFDWIPPCPVCHSCRYVTHNGEKQLKARKVNRYHCTSCPKDFTYPYESDIRKMNEFHEKVCPNCSSVLHFVEEDHPLYSKLRVIRCTRCGNSFSVWEDEANSYVRNSVDNEKHKK